MKPKLIILDARSIAHNLPTGVIKVGRDFLKQFRKLANQEKRLIVWTNNLKKKDPTLIKEKKYLIHIHTRIPNILLHLILKFLPFFKIDHLLVFLANARKKHYSKNTKTFYFGFDLRSINLSKSTVKSSQYIHDIAFHDLKENLSTKAKFFYFLINPRKTIQKMDLIFTNSEFSQKRIQQVFQAKKIKVIPPGLARTVAKYKLPNIKKQNYILCISSSDPRKNLDQLTTISQNHPEQKFILVSNNFNYYKKQNLTLNSNIESLENLQEEELTKLIQEAKATIYLSKYEGFGMPIYESIQNHTPVIVNRTKHYLKAFKEKNLNFITKDNKIPSELKIPSLNNLYISKHQARKLFKAITKL